VLFLDEIGDMPMLLQTRLLRVLQEKEVTPLGASQSTPVNFALICATHRNLAQHVADGTFREDLLYRLREFALTIPPLRSGLNCRVSSATMARPSAPERDAYSSRPRSWHTSLPWPGNVRQLQSLMKVLLALAEEGEQLEVEDLPAEYQSAPAPARARVAAARCAADCRHAGDV
jgi:transcriptional regulator of acetoin/glycerol metabolism